MFDALQVPIPALESKANSTSSTVRQAYVFALDPTTEQADFLRSHIGGSRFCYNALLSLVKANWDDNLARKNAGIDVSPEEWFGTSHFNLRSLWAEHRDELAPWWGANGWSTYNDASQRLSRAFTNWRQGRAKFPVFKTKGPGGSVRFANTAVRLADSHHVVVSRIGEIKTYESTRKLYRHLERSTGRILAATVSERCGRWSISFDVDVERNIPAMRLPVRIIGIDVGLSTLYTGATPEGEPILTVPNPRHFVSSQHRLAVAKRVESRRQGPRNGVAPSNRWQRAHSRVQKIHSEIANSRRNLIHQTTTHLAKQFDVIVIEDLNIAGMLKNHSLAKHISDASWGEFFRQLQYKTQWYGSALVIVDRFYPSTKTCARCGTVKAKLPLSMREFACDMCGHRINRDLNAATNLARMGMAGTRSVIGRGGEVRPEQRIRDARAHPDEALTEALTSVSA